MATIAARTLERVRVHRLALWTAGSVAAILALSAGVIGSYRYVDNYWLYRGFAPPKDPAFVVQRGRLTGFTFASAALGGLRQPVDVYLPPGYAANPLQRYPVIYLLHGFPGVPGSYFRAGRLGVVEDILVAKHKVQPAILVAPYGSTGAFTDKEWANGVRPHERWETYVAHDVVQAVDARYRTIRARWARALVGLSEGGYGALNIGLHHPSEFQVLESWSGYVVADDISSIFGKNRALLRWNSPDLTLPGAAPTLRADRTYVWFYSGSVDKDLLTQNQAFEQELRGVHVDSHYAVLRGGHDWALWRGQAAKALYAVSVRLVPPAPGTNVVRKSHA